MPPSFQIVQKYKIFFKIQNIFFMPYYYQPLR